MNELSSAMRDLHHHSTWANGQLLDAAAQLSPEALRTPIGEGSIGNLLQTLVHVYDAQNSWYQHVRRGMHASSPAPDDFPDISTLRQAWQELDTEMTAWHATLTDAGLVKPQPYPGWWDSKGTLMPWEMLLHAALHSHQHRGEVALILSQLGHSPSDLDFIDDVMLRKDTNS